MRYLNKSNSWLTVTLTHWQCMRVNGVDLWRAVTAVFHLGGFNTGGNDSVAIKDNCWELHRRNTQAVNQPFIHKWHHNLSVTINLKKIHQFSLWHLVSLAFQTSIECYEYKVEDGTASANLYANCFALHCSACCRHLWITLTLALYLFPAFVFYLSLALSPPPLPFPAVQHTV